MNKKPVQLYASENVLEEFYKALIDNNPRAFNRVHIPKSDVFYIREAIRCNTGVTIYTRPRRKGYVLRGLVK